MNEYYLITYCWQDSNNLTQWGKAFYEGDPMEWLLQKTRKNDIYLVNCQTVSIEMWERRHEFNL